jgi:hypothetical protein
VINSGLAEGNSESFDEVGWLKVLKFKKTVSGNEGPGQLVKI